MKLNRKIPVVMLTALLAFASCNKNEDAATPQASQVPTQFNVNIPNSLSPTVTNYARIAARLEAAGDTSLNGGAIYEGIRGYIAVGELGGRAATEIMKLAAVLLTFNVSSRTYSGDNDKRLKNLALTKNASYLGKAYQYKLFIKDSLSGNTALEAFWNLSPVDGIAIISPYNLDKDADNTKNPNALIRVDYSETKSNGYDKQMTVYITGLNTPIEGDFNNLKMFAGLKGNMLDVYGNSNHPNVNLFDMGNVNYAFRAKADTLLDISVAEVILPPSTITSLTNIYELYSVKNVITNYAKAAYPYFATPEGAVYLNRYLKNTTAPGYFVRNTGFVGAGTPPTIAGVSFSSELQNLSSLNVYVPNEIKNLNIGFE